VSEFHLLGFYAVKYGRIVPIFRKNVLLPSSGSKSKRSKEKSKKWNFGKKKSSITLYDIESQKMAALFLVTATRTSNLTGFHIK
jgi:hypothetical protein